jgi:hypothetical protein
MGRGDRHVGPCPSRPRARAVRGYRPLSVYTQGNGFGLRSINHSAGGSACHHVSTPSRSWSGQTGANVASCQAAAWNLSVVGDHRPLFAVSVSRATERERPWAVASSTFADSVYVTPTRSPTSAAGPPPSPGPP